MTLPKIKVCGVTQAADLEALAQLGVDTVGINLVSTSKRFVPLNKAVELALAAKKLRLTTVAVVMNPIPEKLTQICTAVDWDFVQLHGEEAPLLAMQCRGISIIKAVAWNGLAEQEQLVSDWRTACDSQGMVAGSTSRLVAFLLDAYAPGVGGGTGTVARWDLIYPRPDLLKGWPIILAGGLSPLNVNQAIASTKVDGVDVASGVEESPGLKSRILVQQFVAGARQGFAS